jgi:Tetrapyrrole (Corrin/Porphyrin) Methylases
MPHELTDFLLALADHPWDTHQPRLDRALEQAGISERNRRALRGRKPGEILGLVRAEFQAAAAAGPASAAAPAAIAATDGKGELVVVGTGIKGVNDFSREAAAFIRDAQKVLYVVADPIAERLIMDLNPGAEDLSPLYDRDRPRLSTYRLMSERILSYVRAGLRVCAVFYGHPGVFVKPSHLAISTARREGHRAHMMPAVSALDCLFADLNVDPSTHSCQIFGATDLLVHARRIDATATVIIYQAACVGDPGYHGGTFDGRHVPLLSQYLQRFYRPDHAAYIYEAAHIALSNPRVDKTTVAGLPSARLTGASTLYIPPQDQPLVDRDMVQKLGLSHQYAPGRDK